MKKIISLMLVCMMILTLGVSVSADSYGKLTLPNLTKDNLVAANANNPNGYYAIDIKISDITRAFDGESFSGYSAFGFDVSFDATKFTAGYKMKPAIGAAKTVYVSNCKIAVDPNTGESNPITAISGSNPADGILRVQVTAADNSKVIAGELLGDGVLCTVYLAPIADQYGKTTITIENSLNPLCFAGTGGIEDYNFDIVAGSIDLGEDPNAGTDEPVVPEKSTVKTFPKLYWDETNATLTTVGVIAVGQDFDTIKYGINIEKADSTVNYWATEAAVKTTDGAKAFYAIKLGGISDTTDIKATAAAKAILDNETEAGATVTKDSEGTYEE